MLEPDSTEDESSARRRCAISLAFWGGLKPRELASLSEGSLVVQPDGTGELHVPGRQEPVACPTELVGVVHAYRQSRASTRGEREPSAVSPLAPLLTHLGSHEAIGMHSAWQLIKAWPGRGDSTATVLGSKVIRASYVTLASVDSEYALAQIALQTGRRPLVEGDGNSISRAIRIDEVRNRLSAESPLGLSVG